MRSLRKKYVAFAALMLITAVFILPSRVCAEAGGAVDALSARSAILYEAKYGKILYEKNARARLPMASTTKIMTALAIAEALPLDAVIKIPKEAVGIEGSSAYLKEGESFSVEQLVYALLLQSANDAAVALALAADGSIEAFAERMNRTAERLGLADTHFTNPHGLHDDAHYTTAYDLACITAKAMEHPFLRNVFKTKSYRADRETESRIFTNHNKLLNKSIHAVGVKTGYTRMAGRCLVGAADIDGMSLISVTLNAPNDWNDHLSLWQYATDSYEVREILSARGFLQNIPIAGGFLPYLSASNREGFSALLPKNAAPAKVYAEYTPILFAPIRQNDVVGSIVIEQDGKVLKRLPLCADLDVPGLNFN